MPNINEFKSRLRGGGARANQFKVTLPFPGYAAVGGETSDLAFLCRSEERRVGKECRSRWSPYH